MLVNLASSDTLKPKGLKIRGNCNLIKVKLHKLEWRSPLIPIRPRVVDFLFIVTHAHQKMEALFWDINFDYTADFFKKCFVFVSIFFFHLSIKKEKKGTH